MAVHLVIAWLYHYHYYFFTVCIYFPGHSWVQKEKKFWFSYVSTSGGVLAKYLIMGYKVIYMEGCYCRTLKKWKSLSHVWLFATLWTAARDPMDCSLPGSSVHEILQTGILEWVAIPFSRRSSQPRDEHRPPALEADALLSEPPVKPSNIETCHNQSKRQKLLITFILSWKVWIQKSL